ncbi:hypothetical protein [Amaricoccus macauensis]|uniref:hypothetical protein n=1 Tax=Amaricoccus macauensis TaxID=57001 RepID=UPI003C7D2280
MTAIAPLPASPQDLPSLIDRAATMLSGAKTAAEVLEAREAAGFAYDVAKRSARMQRAKSAHDDLIAAAHRAQADALEIESLAKRRLADEYDAAQARGEVATRQCNPGSVGHVGSDNMPPVTATELGLRRDQIHDARLIRDAEVADPGLVRRTLDERLAQGEEPTRSAVRRAAEARLQRSLDRLQRTQDSVRRLEADKAPPLSAEQRARQIAVFGTPQDRAIHERLVEIVERIDEQPIPAEAVRRIPPAARHAVEIAPLQRAAAWLTDFSTLFEQETPQ